MVPSFLIFRRKASNANGNTKTTATSVCGVVLVSLAVAICVIGQEKWKREEKKWKNYKICVF